MINIGFLAIRAGLLTIIAVAVLVVLIVCLKRRLKTTAAWSMLFCVLAAVSPAFTWSYGVGFGSLSDVIDILRSSSSGPVNIAVSAYADWHGAAISIAGGIGLFFLVATGNLKPVPWWRTLGIGIVGAAILTFTNIYAARHWNHFPVREIGGLMAILSSAGLLFIACLEVRWLLDRKSDPTPNQLDAPPRE